MKVRGKLIAERLGQHMNKYHREDLFDKFESGLDINKLYTIKEIMDLIATTSILVHVFFFDAFEIQDCGSIELRLYRRCSPELYPNTISRQTLVIVSDILSELFGIEEEPVYTLSEIKDAFMEMMGYTDTSVMSINDIWSEFCWELDQLTKEE